MSRGSRSSESAQLEKQFHKRIHFQQHLCKTAQSEIFICIRIVMNIQKSASVSEPLSIPGTFLFPLKSRSWVFRKGGFG